MTLDDLLQELRIEEEPVKNENGSYTIDLNDSNEYSRYYTRLDKSELFDEDDEASQVSFDTSSIQYIGDDFIITLWADFDANEYKIIIREMNKNKE